MARELAGSSRTLLWSDKNGGFSVTGEFQNPLYGFVNLENGQDDGSVFGIDCIEATNKRIKETPKQNNEQAEVAKTLMSLRPFGLKLKITPTLLDSVEKNLSHCKYAAQAHYHPKVDDFGSQPISEKLKASNFSASLLRIGKWEQRRSRNEGDLVAKCYYAKKKLVWEFLERGLKSKIEIQWNDIIAMKAVIEENQPGILEIELNQAPTFHEETDPQPRKHTIWKLTSDFTGGQASTCRRHYLVFPPGSLDKHYEKLLQCDHRLYDLCKRPFPSLQSPYFEPNIYRFSNLSFDYNRDHRPDINLLQFNFSAIPPPLVATQHVHSYEQAPPPQPSFKETPSPISVMDFSHSDEQISNKVFDSPRMELWGQAAASTDTIQFAQVMMNPTISCQNYNPSNYVQGGVESSFMNNTLTNLEDQLFSDTQVECYDEKYHMARVESLSALANLSQQQQEENLASKDGLQETFYRQEMGINEHVQFYQQQQQISWNNLSYNSATEDPRMKNFGPVNTNNHFNHWNS